MSACDLWTILNTRHDAHSLGQHNSAFTISNGYLGLKGNLCEDREGYCPVTLINGVYDELDMFSLIRASNEERRYLDPRYFDSAGKSPAVANLPNPLFVRVFVADREISLTRGQVSDFAQLLSLRDGAYSYAFNYRDETGRTTRITMTRFASLAQPHRVYMRYGIAPMDHDAPIRILTGISAAVYSNITRERQFSVTHAACAPAERCLLHCTTPARCIHVRMAVRNVFRGRAEPTALRGVVEHDCVYTLADFDSVPRVPVILDRYISIGSSEDARLGVKIDVACDAEDASQQPSLDALESNRADWAKLWAAADVEIEGDDEAQRSLRFCLYHLLAAAPRHTDRLSVPVKLLTGEYYQGNTFYDTDVHIVPFYAFTEPQVARSCLNWRHVGLEPGREIARDLGYAGAKFAWQAGPRGEECLGRWWRFTHTNIHINADVAYALMQYFRATGDSAFMNEQGLDILVETARFYTSRARCDPAQEGFSLVDVAGPDEGHCESTDNFYTNYLARWNLRWAAEMLERARRSDERAYHAAVKRLDIGADEPASWVRVAERLRLLLNPATNVYEQYDGFYALEPLVPNLSRDRKVWFATVARHQALNQPDVLMAMAMFRDEFSADISRANYDYYYAKSMNFSSMSFAINSIIAAEMGDLEEAYRNFMICAGSDLHEERTGRRDTHAGLHGTAMGGAWMATVLGFGGLRITPAGLNLDPRLPAHWKSLRFGISYHGSNLQVLIRETEVAVRAGEEAQGSVELIVLGQKITVAPGHSRSVNMKRDCGSA